MKRTVRRNIRAASKVNSTQSVADTSSRRRRSPEEAKHEIIQVARKYLLKKNFHGLTVEKLMLTTKIGRSAFYVYFSDLYDLAEIFIHELTEKIAQGAEGWLDRDDNTGAELKSGLWSAVLLWEANGPMIRNLYEASLQDERLSRIWRDKIAMGPINRVADKIRKDQAAGLIVSVDPLEISIALNQFNLTYLNDRFGYGRRRDKLVVLQTLERVWLGTLYGKLPASLS